MRSFLVRRYSSLCWPRGSAWHGIRSVTWTPQASSAAIFSGLLVSSRTAFTPRWRKISAGASYSRRSTSKPSCSY